MKRMTILLALLLTSGCSHTLYVASSEMAVGDKKCTIQTHWTKTSYIIGSKADETLSVRMGGRRPVAYKKEDAGIIYSGERKTDIKVYGQAVTTERFVCGQVQGHSSLKQFDGDELLLTMHCKAKLSPLSLTKGYLPARKAPYVLAVQQKRSYFVQPDAPAPPGCKP